MATMGHDWRSAIMRCSVEDDHCAICRVATHGRHALPEDLWEAIKLLDAKLGDCDDVSRTLLREVAGMAESFGMTREQLDDMIEVPANDRMPHYHG